MTFPCATAGHRIFTPEGSCSLPCGEGCSRETQKNLKKTGPAGCLSPPGLRTLDKFLNRCAQNHKIPTGRGSVLSVTSFTPSSEASAAALSSDFPGLVSPSANPLISSVSERGPLSSCNREVECESGTGSLPAPPLQKVVFCLFETGSPQAVLSGLDWIPSCLCLLRSTWLYEPPFLNSRQGASSVHVPRERWSF